MKASTLGLLLLVLIFPSASGAERTAAAAANGRIAFVTGNGTASMNPDGSGVWSLSLGASDGEPAWSPDGTRLAVAVRWPGIEGITVMEPDGWTNRRRVTFSYGDRDPAWSPDGTRIAYATADARIALVPAAGGASTRISSGPGWDADPAWSPDGKTIAFVRCGAPGCEVWTVDVATGAEARAVAAPATAPSWSPAGELTYVSNGVAFVRSGGSDRQLLANVNWGSPVVWSPDGTKLLFVRDGSLWLADLAGRELGQLGPGSEPAWQPLPPAPPTCTLWGTDGADLLVGTRGDDVVCGLGGDDTVLGMDGNDLLLAGAGADWVAGGQGYDRHDGGAGDDRLDGRDGGADVVVGGPGYDTAHLEAADAHLGAEKRRYGGNRAAWRPVQSSGPSLPDQGVRAVDGRVDTPWNAGGWPPQWIEVDLLVPQAIGRIRLVSGPQPEGVKHLVLGRGPRTGGAYRLLRTVKGPTATRQEIVLRPKRPWRGIRQLRIETHAEMPWNAQWVSWHELEVYAPKR